MSFNIYLREVKCINIQILCFILIVGGHLGNIRVAQFIHSSTLANMDFQNLEILGSILSYVGNCYFLWHTTSKNKPLLALLLLDYKLPHTPANAQHYKAVMMVASQQLGIKCTIPTRSLTRDLWCANPLRYPPTCFYRVIKT